MPPEANDATAAANPPELWRGLEEYMGSPAFRASLENEFPEDAAEWTDPVSRRNFITIMGAGLALAGATGCTPRPASMRKIVPYTRQPEQMIPGVPLFFASAAPLAGYVTGVLVRSHEGRPVKVEGNPDHPSSGGGTGAITQASVLDLYDPDRSQHPTRNGTPVALDEVVRAARTALYNPDGTPKAATRLRLLTGAVTSPSLAARIEALLAQFPAARWAQYEVCGQDNVREGLRRAFGGNYAVNYDFHAADVVLSLDADFLGEGPGHARYSKDFAARRRVRNTIPAGGENEYVTPDGMSRLYVAECMPSITGSTADHRLPLLASQIEGFARAVYERVANPAAPVPAALPELAQKWLDPLVKDLQRAGGKAIVIAGESQPAAVHALAHAINSKLGSVGTTVHVTAPIEARPDGRTDTLAKLVADMNGDQVDVLFVLGGANPAYSAPADVDFVAAVKKVKFALHLGTHQDETAGVCEWHVNEAHYLETWGDGRGHDGTVGLQQPLIAPLYSGRSAAELLSQIAAAPQTDGYEILRAYWQPKLPAPFEPAWQEAVRLGVVPNTAAARQAKVGLAPNWAEGASPAPAPLASNEYEINFRLDPTLFDGRFANNGWLQELPKPVTRISWDNAAYVSQKTGEDLKIEKEFRYTAGERGRSEVTVVTLTLGGKSVKLPVWVLPGHPDKSITVHLGHGRERCGRVGNAEGEKNAEGKLVRGSNVYPLRTSAAPAFATGLKVEKTNDDYYLACIQAYWSMKQEFFLTGEVLDRAPVRRGTNQDYKTNPWFAKITPTAAGETALIVQNVPGQQTTSANPDSGVVRRQGNTYGPSHDEKHDHKDGDDHQHGDRRIHALTMYHPNDRLYPEGSRGPARRWAMAIDLSACTGCNSCMIACQSENNIPTVGKHEITRGHDMYWIRIDRYYEGTPNAPDANRTYMMPVPCQQCEKAPCEIVCPVAATAHSADGLNDMAYNRCVGTRYCSNNCPYKVRRFNFLTFQDWYTESIKLGRNPDVSVRSRGVMEKCTYCVQRIRYAEIVAEREFRPIRDGEVRTACQTACPSGAIVFGDLGDQASQVGKWKAEPSNYGLLAELNTMPRTTYLASLRNPNPALVAVLK
ncbi:TAT-variant-translocated molybdopterin oxidoreductase [Urbifossiella limnaea]|uniref:Tetrathionate reductase subunit B n=1 Tax=Urbifossiella limnaea TaxID=2528023 RepID=A0A517Y0Q1_9BACT|nr:TAT-variant-translocated molybdopterin oxidoreductase [Urbifossiella limnaea]QDU23339.1 Tetrathionate reductase subunit B precursor [Urbifossiella limnaea]